MIENYKEAFEKTRSAGKIAAGALDEVAKIAKPGTRTDQIDSLCYEYINDHGAFLPHYFIEVFLNHVVRQLIMLFVMEYLLIRF